MAGDSPITKINVLRKLFTKGSKLRKSKPMSFDKAKSFILTDLEECTPKWCHKNGVNNFFFLSGPITSLLI